MKDKSLLIAIKVDFSTTSKAFWTVPGWVFDAMDWYMPEEGAGL